jgi:hypothetical protein
MALTLLARAFMMTMNSFVFLTKLMMIIHKYISLFAFFRWFDSQNMSGFFGTEEVKLTHRKLLGVLRGRASQSGTGLMVPSLRPFRSISIDTH